MEERNSVYVYAVARPFPQTGLGGARGVDGRPVGLVAEGDLAAAVSTVPLSAYGEAAFRARLADVDWLESVARAHHRVVDEVSQHAAVIPLALATVRESAEHVRELLRAEHGRFTAILARLSGRVEWRVRIATRSPGAPGPRPNAGASSPSAPRRPYDARRGRAPHAIHDEPWHAAVALARRVDDLVGGLAEAREDHPPLDAPLSAAGGTTVMNASYLVPAERTPRVLRIAERLRAGAPRDVRVVVSGPWAPYSFAMPIPGTTGSGDPLAPVQARS
ncbi:hypothetical protein HNR23_002060 [Nocardiopsis mwathae]|uniref:GvpL/GvpF family gas vesicle protein n=1 Tax=Nocardiopsis mwathae TaxID=1472723 RepID=A0A7W9YH11_9ACTN|nr:hypothetical protein [Nocardiopsis mwathae]